MNASNTIDLTPDWDIHIMNDMNDVITAEVQRRAYLMWERENRPEGRYLEHWRCAKAEVEAERTPATGLAESCNPDPSNAGSGGSAAKARDRRNA